MVLFGLELPLVLVLVGLGLMILEAMSPGAYLIVVGVALTLAGLLGMFVAPAAQPIALAGTTLLFGAGALWVYREFDFYGSGSAGQTTDSSSLQGSTGRVVERVSATEGRVKVEDGGFNPYYQARSTDGEIPAGEEVLVIDPGGGNVVTVTPMNEIAEDEIDRELRRDAEGDGDGGAGGDDDTDGDDGGGGDADVVDGVGGESEREEALEDETAE